MDSSIRLANCAGSREYNPANEERLKNDLLQVLLATGAIDPESTDDDLDFSAKFLSLTITASEPISILLEHRLLDRLGGSLLGAKNSDDALVPITLDLRDLPLEATGIVCGVAGRLAQGHTDADVEMTSGSPSSMGGGEPIEISFLSTVRAGTVVVREGQLERAVRALEVGMRRVEDLV